MLCSEAGGYVSGAFIVVQEGLKAGEQVVIEGVQKVKTGQTVTVQPADTSTLQLSSAPVAVPQSPTSPAGGGPVEAGSNDADATAPR